MNSTQGAFTRWRTKWFGHTDETTRQVRRLQRQGALMAHVAHTVANVMIVLISLATLITLGKSTGQAFLISVQAGHPDWMKGIAIAILFTLVVSMDTAVLYGSNMIRTLVSRGANEKLLISFHALVVALIATLEGFTYWIMILTYEHPTNALEYHIGQARAFGAPAIAIYLALATVLSVTKSDILNIAAVQSGIVSVQKVSDRAGDESTPLAQVWAIFDAASGVTREDGRVHAVITALNWDGKADPRTIVEADPVPPGRLTLTNSPTPAPKRPTAMPHLPTAPAQQLSPDVLGRIDEVLHQTPRPALPKAARQLGLPMDVVARGMATLQSTRYV